MFTVEERDRVREHVLELARGDARVVAGAEVGSLALGEGDRWSDLDLTFGITDGVAVTEILDDWTSDLVARFDAAHLFDLVADVVTELGRAPDNRRSRVEVSMRRGIGGGKTHPHTLALSLVRASKAIVAMGL